MKDTKQQWFKDSKFGLFIHWGLYSLLAGEYKGRKTKHVSEWIMNDLNIPLEEYKKLATVFHPMNFDANYVVRKAKQWGMKYIVFTAKHHDGFAMWHSKSSLYNIVDATPYKKDILEELRQACDAYGMKLGLYYSQSQDWEDPNGYMNRKDNSKKNFSTYLHAKCIPQIKELLTEYGDIALLWFDTPMGITYEESKEIVSIVKEIQPNCIVSGRIGNGLGEYMTTGDNFIPRLPYEGDWEVPATLNDNWGFNKHDSNWKNVDEIIRLLVKINSRGGNYLLNIGPNANGEIPDESINILDQVGEYVQENAEAIFFTKRSTPYLYEMDWGEMTQKDHKLFVHIFKPRKRIELLNIANRIKKIYIVSNNQNLKFSTSYSCEKCSALEVDLPEEYYTKKNYSICIDYDEIDPVFEPFID